MLYDISKRNIILFELNYILDSIYLNHRWKWKDIGVCLTFYLDKDTNDFVLLYLLNYLFEVFVILFSIFSVN